MAVILLNQLDYPQELGIGKGYPIRDYGCVLIDVTSILINVFKKQTDPLTLNQNLAHINGYVSNGEPGILDILDWNAITRLYPDITLTFNNLYPSEPADMSLIDSQLEKGFSVIVGVSYNHIPTDTKPTHYVEIYDKNADGTYQCRNPYGGADQVFDKEFAVNGMTVPQCILQAVSYSGSTPKDYFAGLRQIRSLITQIDAVLSSYGA